MKLPVVWITMAFAAGIALAIAMPLAHAGPVEAWPAAAIAAMLAGGVVAWRGLIVPAWACALAAWFALGGAAVGLERASVPANHVTRLIAAGRLDTSEPLPLARAAGRGDARERRAARRSLRERRPRARRRRATGAAGRRCKKST